MTKDKLKHVNMWHGVYNGLPFEIKNSKNEGLKEYNIEQTDNWTYYIYFTKHRLPVSLFNFLTVGIKETKLGSCNYSDSPLSDLIWHCGATFSELTRNENAELVCLKMGCDYMHYWDEGNEYSLDDVLKDVKETINDFCNKYHNELSVKDNETDKS